MGSFVVMGKAKGLRQDEERVEVSVVGARVSRKGDGVRVAESEGRGVHTLRKWRCTALPAAMSEVSPTPQSLHAESFGSRIL